MKRPVQDKKPWKQFRMKTTDSGQETMETEDVTITKVTEPDVTITKVTGVEGPAGVPVTDESSPAYQAIKKARAKQSFLEQYKEAVYRKDPTGILASSKRVEEEVKQIIETKRPRIEERPMPDPDNQVYALQHDQLSQQLTQQHLHQMQMQKRATANETDAPYAATAADSETNASAAASTTTTKRTTTEATGETTASQRRNHGCRKASTIQSDCSACQATDGTKHLL